MCSRDEKAPTEKQSARASGGSTIIQASGSSTIIHGENVTIINAGVLPETEMARLRELSASLEARLLQKYRYGYALLGIANGKIVYEPYRSAFRLRGDWENWRIVINENVSPTVAVKISKLEVDWEVGWIGLGGRLGRAAICRRCNCSQSVT
jgi:hypothetical protein